MASACVAKMTLFAPSNSSCGPASLDDLDGDICVLEWESSQSAQKKARICKPFPPILCYWQAPSEALNAQKNHEEAVPPMQKVTSYLHLDSFSWSAASSRPFLAAFRPPACCQAQCCSPAREAEWQMKEMETARLTAQRVACVKRARVRNA